MYLLITVWMFVLFLFIRCSSIPISSETSKSTLQEGVIGLGNVQQIRKVMQSFQHNVRGRDAAHSENTDMVLKRAEEKNGEVETKIISNDRLVHLARSVVEALNISQVVQKATNIENTNPTVNKVERPSYMIQKSNDSRDIYGGTDGTTSAQPEPEHVSKGVTTESDYYGQDVPIVGVRPRKTKKQETEVEDDATEIESQTSQSTWGVAGGAFGVACVVVIIGVAIVAKGSKSHERSQKLLSHEAKYPDWIGPPSFSETISLPSNTDGSVSQGEQLMAEDTKRASTGNAKGVQRKKSESQIQIGCLPDVNLQKSMT